MRKLEIERKFLLDEAGLRLARDYLARRATHLHSEVQVDSYLSPPTSHYLDSVYPFEWLSIRDRGKSKSINYKHFFPEGAETHEYADEIEIGIDDVEAVLDLMTTALRCELLTVVRKTRDTYRIATPQVVTVALDHIDDLGHFIELEILLDPGASDTEVASANHAIETLVKEMSLSQEDQDKRGYPFRLLERAGRTGSFKDHSSGPCND